MARQESEREDLLHEATALVERAELLLAGQAEPVVIGFRRDGAGSIYCGGDPVFQFNSRNELRRGFRNGLLIKVDHGKLVELRRERDAETTWLVRHDLTDEEAAEYLAFVENTIGGLRDQLEFGAFQVVGQVPAEADVLGRIRRWLADLAGPISVAATPRVR